VDVPVDVPEVLLPHSFLFNLPIHVNRVVPEFCLCASVLSSFKGNAEVLPDEGHLETPIVVPASWHILEHSRPWVVGINTPASRGANRHDRREHFGIDPQPFSEGDSLCNCDHLDSKDHIVADLQVR